MSAITKVIAEEILDSRGNPTLRVSVFAAEAVGVFEVPSGASTGAHEAVELRDGDPAVASGKGVRHAIQNVNEEIAQVLIGFSVEDQKGLDARLNELDGTSQKSRLGANAIVGVSIAAAKAAALLERKPLFEYLRSLSALSRPSRVTRLYMNLINGGKHVATQNASAFQEYHVVPLTESVKESLELGIRFTGELKKELEKKFGAEKISMGDEGGFVLPSTDVRQPLEIMANLAERLQLRSSLSFALDVAASSFFEKGQYRYGEKVHSAHELMELYASLISDFGLISIEDPFGEEDFENFAALLAKHPGLLVVGDDLTVTNAKRLSKAIKMQSVNALIIKPNQIGTLTETITTMEKAKESGVECIVSHRSGETKDDFIADLAMAFGTFGIKAGAPTRSERLIKYQRMVEIEKKYQYH